jgi:hypothetical protein
VSTLTKGNPALAKSVSFKAGRIYVLLEDGREIGVPVGWFPRLERASEGQRENYRLIAGGLGIRFPDLDEDISVERLLD